MVLWGGYDITYNVQPGKAWHAVAGSEVCNTLYEARRGSLPVLFTRSWDFGRGKGERGMGDGTKQKRKEKGTKQGGLANGEQGTRANNLSSPHTTIESEGLGQAWKE